MIIFILLNIIWVTYSKVSRPHIVFIMADDLGWGDVGWNNPVMADVTQRLSKLAKSGVTLSQYYVQQVCSPSRSALLTGDHSFEFILQCHVKDGFI